MTAFRAASRLALPSALALVAVLAGCGPIPVEQAERNCLKTAQRVYGPRTEVSLGVGIGDGKPRTYSSVSFEVSSASLNRRDPAESFARCVQGQSGQPPLVPLENQPGWQGYR